MSSLEELEKQSLQEVAGATDPAVLDDVRVRYLGKKGLLTGQLKNSPHRSSRLEQAL